MKFVLGGCAVALAAAVLTAFPYALPDALWLRGVTGAFVICYALMTGGAWRGATAFSKGDKLRTAWLLIAASGIVGGVSCIWFGPPVRGLPGGFGLTTFGFVMGIIVDLLLNGTTIAGLVLFARAWSETGLVPPWQRPATVAACAVGLVIAGPSLWNDIHAAIAGDRPAIGASISDLGDIVSITLVGPLFASAMWMRGGALVGPFIYLTAYAVAWLVFDAGGHIGLGGHWQAIFDSFFAAGGNIFAGLAGYAHYDVIRNRSSHPPA